MTAPLTKLQIQELIRLFNKHSKSTVGIEYDETDTTDILSDINSSYAKYTQKYLKRASIGADKQDSERRTNFVKVVYKILTAQLTPEVELLDLFDYPPVALPATDILDTSYTANWEPFIGAEGFEINYSIYPNWNFVTSSTLVRGVQFSQSITGQPPSTIAYYRIRAFKVVDMVTIYSPWSNRISLTTAAPVLIANPVQNAATNMTLTTFQVNWDAYQYATGYKVDVSIDAGFSTLVVTDLDVPGGLVTSVVITGMVAQDDYWIRIRAYNTVSTSPNSNPVQTATISLQIPTILAASSINNTHFIANWVPTTDSEGYLIQVCLASDNFSPNLDSWNDRTVAGISSSNILVIQYSPSPPILAGTNYKYRIRAYKYFPNLPGPPVRVISGFSSEQPVTTTSAVVVMPTVTTTAQTNVTDISATSGGNVTDDGGATVTVRGVCWDIITAPTTADPKTTDGSGLGSFVSSITPLVSETLYYVRAYATNTAGTAYGNEISFTTEATPLEAPIADAATDVIDISFTANWQAVVGATGYEIDVATDAGFTSIVPGYNSYDVGNALSLSIFSNVFEGTDYYYRVRAYNMTQTSDDSNTVSLSTTYSLLDMDGNRYTTVIINSNEWLVENYRTTTLADSTPIKKGSFTDLDLFTSWGNIDLTSLNTSGADFISLTSGSAGQYAQTNEFTLYADTIVHYDLNYHFVSGSINPVFTLMKGGIDVSAPTSVGEGSNTLSFTAPSSGTDYRIKVSVPSGTSTWTSSTSTILVYDEENWITTTNPAYCYYDNDFNNLSEYGALYNWYAISDPNFVYLKRNNIEEGGWIVPTETDWDDLNAYLTGIYGANDHGYILRETSTAHWTTNDGTDDEGFKALGAGSRNGLSGAFENLTLQTFFGMTPEDTPTTQTIIGTSTVDSSFSKQTAIGKKVGVSVRLFKQPI